MSLNLTQLAREIIESNQYMTVGTVDSDGGPWVSPVVYAYDGEWNFYFVSIPDSKHCINIKRNNKMALAIFDSRQLFGEGVGLQIEGMASELNLREVPQAVEIYFQRKYPYGKFHYPFNVALKNFLEKKLYHFYKVTPTKVWMNDPREKIDIRTEVYLEED